MNIGHEASIPNPALEPFARAIGKWTTVGSHPYVPDTVFHGTTVFEWLDGGAFLAIRSEIEEVGIPSGIAIVGSDDATNHFFMLYFDERGVSRKYDVFLRENGWEWQRTAPGFSQRCSFELASDARSMVAKGELSKDGMSWEGDLELAYYRAD